MAQNATPQQIAELQQQEQQQHDIEQAMQDLSVIFPDQTVFLQGQQIQVREYRFVEWLQLRQQYALFISKFTTLMTVNDDVLVDDVLEFFEDEFDDLQGLMAISIQQPIEFLSQISSSEMESLMLTWWQVNKHFFMKSVVRAMRKNAKTATTPPSAGQM